MRICNALVLYQRHDCSDELDVCSPDGCAASSRQTKKSPALVTSMTANKNKLLTKEIITHERIK